MSDSIEPNNSSSDDKTGAPSGFGRIGAPIDGSYNLGLTALHPPYKTVLRVVNALAFLLPMSGFIILDAILYNEGLMAFGPISLVGLIIYLLLVIVLPQRRFRRWGYAMEADRLRVLRGFLFRTDTVVPFNRIQHIDVGQGPIERMFNVSKLTVHTAGTHNSVVTLPGLEPEIADNMRETIRSHIREEMI